MGAQTDRLRCEVCQNLFLSPINTGLLRYAVATALTVYGIETSRSHGQNYGIVGMLQQPLPFTVLKLFSALPKLYNFISLQQPLPFTVLKLKVRNIYQFTGRIGCNSPYRLRY